MLQPGEVAELRWDSFEPIVAEIQLLEVDKITELRRDLAIQQVSAEIQCNNTAVAIGSNPVPSA